MLIEFSTGNFASFKETVTFSMVAARIRSKNKDLDSNNVIEIDKNLSLLRSAAIYGKNASGKSNLVKAANFMCQFIRESFRETQFDEDIPIERFRLSTDTDEQPSFFEMVFLLEDRQYRYGFEADLKCVQSEWLYMVPKTREILLFEREGQEIKVNPSNALAKEFRAIATLLLKIDPEQPLRANALFLSVAAQNNGPAAKKVLTWFSDMRFMSGLSDRGFRHFTIDMFADPEMREKIVEMVHALDVDIQDIDIQQLEHEKVLLGVPSEVREILERLPPGKMVRITTQHQKLNSQGEAVGSEILDMGEHESEGTQKLFFMTGPIIDTLAHGRVLWVDEMEARMHPNMTEAIVGLFNSTSSNPKRAQLVFTTHDTNLLNVKKLRRDQIWFIDKDHIAASKLYSLVEFKIRNDDASLEEDYLRGRYGAVPQIGELQTVYEVKSE